MDIDDEQFEQLRRSEAEALRVSALRFGALTCVNLIIFVVSYVFLQEWKVLTFLVIPFLFFVLSVIQFIRAYRIAP